MKIYRISSVGGDASAVTGEHQGYQYVSNKRDLRKSLREATSFDHDAEFEVINVEISKRGILEALNKYGEHPNNG